VSMLRLAGFCSSRKGGMVGLVVGVGIYSFLGWGFCVWGVSGGCVFFFLFV
jgi:hypothetical protein